MILFQCDACPKRYPYKEQQNVEGLSTLVMTFSFNKRLQAKLDKQSLKSEHMLCDDCIEKYNEFLKKFFTGPSAMDLLKDKDKSTEIPF